MRGVMCKGDQLASLTFILALMTLPENVLATGTSFGLTRDDNLKIDLALFVILPVVIAIFVYPIISHYIKKSKVRHTQTIRLLYLVCVVGYLIWSYTGIQKQHDRLKEVFGMSQHLHITSASSRTGLGRAADAVRYAE